MIRRTAIALTAAYLSAWAGPARADGAAPVEQQKLKPVFVSEPSVPTLTPAVRDLPDFVPDPNMFGLEMKRREDFGFITIEYPIKPVLDPLYEIQRFAGPRSPDAFSTPIHIYAGQSSSQSPPDTSGDVGTTYFVQSANQSVSTVRVIDKATGANVKTFTLQSLATSSPCNSGFCDAVVNYDRAADRWIISELPASTGSVCVYISTTGDPTGTWNAYTFAVETSGTDYPKYGVWPQNGNGGSYLIGVNAGSGGLHDLFALDRAKMLAGQPATFQKWSVPNLANLGFQLVLPSAMQGNTPPPNGEPAIFMRPHDDESQDGASTPGFDLLDMWALTVDWTTPANSVLTTLTPLHMGDYDMTLCGVGSTWNCMPQPGTTQKLDPIREPLHFPLQYRNFGDHQTLVGTFPEDVDGTDHAALRWFELRKSTGSPWSLFQEGLIGGEAGVHRSVGSIAMDGSGNMAIGYTRTGTAAPYYPSIYYKGRLATDPLGTMPQGEYVIQDGTFSKIGNERWGDYAGMGIDPVDDCTFWFTTEYMTSNSAVATKVAAMKFDACGCLALPPAPAAFVAVPQDNRIDVGWNDSSTTSIVQYQVFRSTTAGGAYTQIASVPDASPGVGNGAPYTYHDDTVSGGTRYYYVVKSTDGVTCFSGASNEVNALATGQCRLAPAFAGVAAVGNPGSGTCSLNLTWNAGSSVCAGGVTYNVYRSATSGFTPNALTRIATGVASTGYTDAVGISGGTPYYYVVRAVDVGSGVEEANTIQKTGVPTGPLTTSSFTDTFEGAQSGGGFDQAGWTKSPLAGSTTWAWSTLQKHDGTHSWFAADVGSVSDKVLVSPSFGVGSITTLSFWHTFKFEFSSGTCWDGGTLEYTTNGGSSWTVVPAADFTAGAYTGTVSTSSSNPIGGKPAWCNGTIAAMTLVSVNLGGDANLLNKTVQVRWHEGDDVNTTSSGWYVDTVSVNNAQVGGACVPGSACTAPGAPNFVAAVGDCAGVNLSWSAGSGSTASYNISRGTAPGVYVKLAGMPVAGTSYTDTTAVPGVIYYYVVTGACDAGGVTESLPSGENSATRLVTGSACNDGNACTQTDTCQSGACLGVNPVVCTPLDACHVAGACNTGTGLCANPPEVDGAGCTDGNPCTANDSCLGGACVPGVPVTGPGGASGLAVAGAGDLNWAATADATGYDVIRGTLSTLTGGGGFASATDACVASNIPGTFVNDAHVPAPDDADWYLIRARNICGTGTFDEGDPSQAGSREGAIAASSNTCP